MTKMIAKCTQQKELIDDSMNWAQSEIESFTRS